MFKKCKVIRVAHGKGLHVVMAQATNLLFWFAKLRAINSAKTDGGQSTEESPIKKYLHLLEN